MSEDWPTIGDELYRLLVVRGYAQHEAAEIAAGPARGRLVCCQKPNGIECCGDPVESEPDADYAPVTELTDYPRNGREQP